MNTALDKIRHRPEFLLILMAIAVPISFATWQTLLNNFAIEQINFTGREIGILQSLREVPGFMAFSVVFILLFIKEQRLAYISLIILGLGTAITGWFPSVIGLYITTVIMSVGFHYYETLQSSLSLQWFDKKNTAEMMGKLIAASSFASVLTYFLIWLSNKYANLDYKWIYVFMGSLTILIAVRASRLYPMFPQKTVQHKHIVLRKRYWLYYTLTFMSGARRQIFVVFAGFLMVEKFGYSVSDIALLFMVNAILNIFLAQRIGRFIGRIGERKSLIIEYTGLVLVFSGYALVEDGDIAAALYILDHLFFAMAIALKTYFQKIADPADIASTAGVSFSINHIAAVIIPVIFGLIWLISPATVFYAGALMAFISLLFSLLIPSNPDKNLETIFK